MRGKSPDSSNMSDAEMQEEELEVEWNNILMILMDTIMIMVMITIMMARNTDYAGKESACSIANHADSFEMR